ncbi:hypothetical protein P154DRAFT_457353 [Amniculicola lignicola CBS 123094]|uniref:RING-type domain-containing protein n=1 Tax=Amniculicola lignicola CBS 123094 TaxID=1392246 RepID=A0A6A5WWQ5_9PLEO|nr:hypothetical protein P154DRAFT_457353 [Amniculicola lignicola CBS 123094]
MSVNVEAPPVLFAPSSPAYSPSPQSPTHLHHTQTPVSSPPADIDMSTSTTLPPTGQNHDRDDADAQMEDPEGLTNGHVPAEPAPTNPHGSAPDSIAVEVAAVDDDAMDTTPDDGQGLVLPNGSADPLEAVAVASTAPASNGAPEVDGNSEQPPAETPADTAVLPIEPPPIDPNVQPPPPPPPAEPVRSDSDSSDDDDGGQPWHPIVEDTSVPDEAELKEIEAGVEVSALDHEHWENKAFPPLEDPEYKAVASGRIDWVVEHYNGTKEQPNRDLVMKSPPMKIGGYEFQIKFYPKGNDSDYLSVYVECLGFEDKTSKPEDGTTSEPPVKAEDEMAVDVDEAPKTPITEEPKFQHAPLPVLGHPPFPKRRAVAAQVSVVLYNPSEPRVNYARTCLHRYCNGSPDWGWTRFHGPYYDIPHRMRGQRQALLRDDKLAFTGYVRIVEDETDCLWEHHNRENNPWDSFAMTGLQSLAMGEGTGSPGGHLISAIASWMLFKPFRKFLYDFHVPDPDLEPFVRPKPLIAALQKVLYMLRTQVKPGAGTVLLDDVLDALEWYGINERLDKQDVTEVWEILRLRMEEELQGTSFADILDDIFGAKRDYTTGIPSYRAPVIGVETMQQAVNKAVDFAHPTKPLPQLLTIELERQEFDIATRSYVKLMNKVTLDDHITVRGTPYTLYGFVVHRQTLQSYLYEPILRPEGPGSKWYIYTDAKEENMVKCLTKRAAVDVHEGKPGKEKVVGNDPIAYIVMYVRDDLAEFSFNPEHDSEPWQAPEWIRLEVEKQQASSIPPPIAPPPIAPPPIAPPPVEEPPATTNEEVKPVEEKEAPKLREFQLIDSTAFVGYEGPGIFDPWDAKWTPGTASNLVYSVTLASTDGRKEIRDKIAAVVRDIKDPRQIKFWLLDTLRGNWGRPNLLGTGSIEYSSGSMDHYIDESKPWTLQDHPYAMASHRIWIHVTDFADLPELPKEVPAVPEPPQVPSDPSENTVAAEVPPPPPPVDIPQSEDTPMSEPDEPDVAQPEVPVPVPTAIPEPTAPAEVSEPTDTAMGDVEVEVAVEPTPAADPPAVDVIVSNPSIAADTEMGGTQDENPPPLPPPLDDLPPPPPPPPPADLQIEPVPPPPAPPVVTQQGPPPPPPPPDEIYFFLKFFDAELQTLESRGSHIALNAARVDSTVLTLLGLPADKKIDLFEEEDLTTVHPIRLRRSFAQNDLHNTTVIIATFPLTDEQRESLAVRAVFADPQQYLVFRANARNSPSKLTGHFTYNYFSSQYYKGEYKNGHQHGHGMCIYHSGATYEGSFRLGLRYGHGLYTSQNGDTYDGEWVANQQHGTGTFVEATTGNTYVGGWKQDKKFGEGVTHWKNAQETERLCRICWEDEADAAFYDCGHVVACLPCARRVDSCPVCRKRVLSAMKLYYVA